MKRLKRPPNLKIKHLTQKGFSLIEILIALTLLVLAGSFVGSKIFEQFGEGQVNSAKIQLQGLGGILDEYRRKCNRYPAEIAHLISPPAECSGAPPTGFIEGGELPIDPWENEFEYSLTSNGRKYILRSYGADGAPGGDGSDKDICSYNGKIKDCSEAQE